jgi:hypothetical protein
MLRQCTTAVNVRAPGRQDSLIELHLPNAGNHTAMWLCQVLLRGLVPVVLVVRPECLMQPRNGT